MTEQRKGEGGLALSTLTSPLRPKQVIGSSVSQWPLRAVHIISGDLWAGAEVQVFTLLKQLHRHIDLHVIIMNPGELAQRCLGLGIPITLLDESRQSSLTLFTIIRRRLRALQPDIVHTHRQKENVIGSLANLFSCRARCIRTVHGAPEFLPNYRQKLQGYVDTLCGRYLQQGIVAVSVELKQKLARHFVADRLQVILNGIDPDEVQAEAQPPLQFSNDNLRHIGLVGRVEAVKRPDLFLNMAALLISQGGKQWRFHVFGDGGQLDSMKQLANQLGIAGQVHFHGHRRDIRRAIAALDAVVMPSDHEGLPMTALETLALGVRLVAHDIGGLSDLLADHQHLLVKDHSPQGYAHRLVDALSQAPPEDLKSAYLASNNAAQVLSLYQKLSWQPAPESGY